MLCNKLYSVTAVYLAKQVSSDMYFCVAFWIYVLVSLVSEFSVHKRVTKNFFFRGCTWDIKSWKGLAFQIFLE